MNWNVESDSEGRRETERERDIETERERDIESRKMDGVDIHIR